MHAPAGNGVSPCGIVRSIAPITTDALPIRLQGHRGINMPREKSLSPGAALLAVATAFVVGLLASLAIRPPGAVASQTVTASEGEIREQVRWRVQAAYGVNKSLLNHVWHLSI